MTVIAWDGTTLAADKRACNGSLIGTVTKIFRIRDCLVGYSGDAAFGEQMRAWFAAGEHAADFPSGQRDKDDYAVLLVIRPDGKVQRFERTPHPITFEDRCAATGSGRDFAIAAMHLGFNAARAVEVASQLTCDCGNGVDTLRLDAMRVF